MIYKNKRSALDAECPNSLQLVLKQLILCAKEITYVLLGNAQLKIESDTIPTLLDLKY